MFELKNYGIIQEYLYYIKMLLNFYELLDIKNIFINHSLIICDKVINYYLKIFINELISVFLNLKFLFIKFCYESGFKKTAINYFENFRRHYEYIMPDNEKFKNMFSVFNSSNINDDRKYEKNEEKKEEKNLLYNYISLMINFRGDNLKYLHKLK
jgi:hypothetical protein